MRHLLLLTTFGLIVPSALAGPEILPISGVDRLNYDVQTGKVTPATLNTRSGHCIWCCGYEYVSYFWDADPFAGEAGLDWGDIAGPANVGGLGFAEFTNSQAADGDLYGIVAIYTEENGWDSAGRVYVVGFLIGNIPGSTHPPNEYWGYVWDVDVGTAFVLDGSDLDGDGLTDWGYFQLFSGRTPGCRHGPAICGFVGQDPNNLPPECPGVEDAFDLFVNPNWNNDPNNIDPNNLEPIIEPYYVGTYWFGGLPLTFAQFYFELFGEVGCPYPGATGAYCTADIDGDCDVDVTDLALCQIIPPPWECDVDGDGHVTLVDLALIIEQIGDDCSVCLNPGEGGKYCTGDIEGYDCVVDISDLSKLLSNYGATAGMTRWDGDIEPAGGDGDVDLADLAELLSQYGDDCNWP